MTTVQYRITVSKSEELVDGPDDADAVVTVPVDVVTAADFDPAVAFMQGRLKSSGSTGALFAVLRSGAAAASLSRLASPL